MLKILAENYFVLSSKLLLTKKNAVKKLTSEHFPMTLKNSISPENVFRTEERERETKTLWNRKQTSTQHTTVNLAKETEKV